MVNCYICPLVWVCDAISGEKTQQTEKQKFRIYLYVNCFIIAQVKEIRNKVIASLETSVPTKDKNM